MKIKETNLKFQQSLIKRKLTKKVILHHADAKECDASMIHNWHLANRWAGIGYHYVIRKDGTIERGRPEDVIGAHCTNQNYDSIGICFEGDYEIEQMPEVQKEAAKVLITYLLNKYSLTCKDVYRHSDFLATSCPGRNFPFEEIRTTKKKLKKGAKVKIKSGAKDLNTKKKYSDFVYSTEYVVHKVAATYVVFGNGTTATGKTRKKNVIVQ